MFLEIRPKATKLWKKVVRRCHLGLQILTIAVAWKRTITQNYLCHFLPSCDCIDLPRSNAMKRGVCSNRTPGWKSCLIWFRVSHNSLRALCFPTGHRVQRRESLEFVNCALSVSQFMFQISDLVSEFTQKEMYSMGLLEVENFGSLPPQMWYWGG